MDENRLMDDPTGGDSLLGDFQEGQWWVVELDAMAQAPATTDDQKRAVAVVHHLLRVASQAASDRVTICDIRQDYCERVPAFYEALKYALGEKSWGTIYARLESQQFTKGDLICALAESLLDLRGI